MGAFLIFVIVAVIYFLPTINAMSGVKHKNSDAILLVNLFFGWSGLGWLIALIWSVTK